jgi:hypothetical protein
MDNLQFSTSETALACSMPNLGVYQEQKKIQVVTTSQLSFGTEIATAQVKDSCTTLASTLFYQLRLKAALAQGTDFATEAKVATPSYFPGPIIPGPGGPHCHEVNRGNLLFDQFKHLLSYDMKAANRLEQPSPAYQSNRTSLFATQAPAPEEWAWTNVEEPQLSFLHQVTETTADRPTPNYQFDTLNALQNQAQALYSLAKLDSFSLSSVTALLRLIRQAWHQSIFIDPAQTEAAVEQALLQAAQFLKDNQEIIGDNLLYVLFELDAMIAYQSISANLRTFASGVFAGNFVEVALYPLVKLGATEFCVRERLFDEVINLVGRGFAPVVINEHGLIADGNHRVTASWIWNILKYTAAKGCDWSLDDHEFQKAIAEYFTQSKESAVSRHEALSHLAHFLSRPEYRSKLNTYIRPLLADYDYIKELPVVFLPEYLSQAVVKSHYDEGTKIERACPSVYETLALNDSLVLPPRASYHFTDSALLPWFTVLVLLRQNQEEEHQTRFRHNGKRSRLRARSIPAVCREQKKNTYKTVGEK